MISPASLTLNNYTVKGIGILNTRAGTISLRNECLNYFEVELITPPDTVTCSVRG
jgi:hypothetical protein